MLERLYVDQRNDAPHPSPPITVILVAVIGTFVLDLGQSAGETAPQASLLVELDTSNNDVIVEHTGGDALSQENTRMTIENESSGSVATFDTGSSAGTMSVGGSTTFTISSGSVSGDLSLQSASTTFKIVSGTQYTITVIDTQSQRQVFETTVTA